jgi:hypothetical protein
LAVAQGDVEVARALVESGADKDTKDKVSELTSVGVEEVQLREHVMVLDEAQRSFAFPRDKEEAHECDGVEDNAGVTGGGGNGGVCMAWEWSVVWRLLPCDGRTGSRRWNQLSSMAMLKLGGCWGQTGTKTLR